MDRAGDAGGESGGTWLSWSRDLSGAGPDAIPGLRRWARELVGDLPAELLVDVLLVIVELATNAIEHGGGLRSVRLSRSPGRDLLHVEVEDCNLADLTPGVSRFGAPANRGRGLTLVTCMVQEWGVRREDPPGHKVVWATLATASVPERTGPCAVDADTGAPS